MNHVIAHPTDPALTHRGIDEVARQAGWRRSSRGWTYPVYDLKNKVIARRGKAYHSSATPKYWWPTGKPTSADYYLLSGLREGIQQQDGLIYLVSGEPDLLTLKAAGLHNVLCWFGETSVPPNLPNFLRDLGVTRAIQYPDLDATGMKSARKVAAALHPSEIDFEARALPDWLGDKGDLNALWMQVKFDVAAFLRVLTEETSTLQLDIQTHKQRKRPIASLDIPDDFLRAIAERLGVEKFKPNGWSKAIACPMRHHEHDDKNPAASWHREMHILKCFKCGETWLAKSVAATLNIRWEDFVQRDVPKPQAKAKDTHAADLQYFPNGVPDKLRATLLALHRRTDFLDQASALTVLDLRQLTIAEGQLTPDGVFTVADLRAYAVQSGRATTEKTIRRGLNQLMELGFVVLHYQAALQRGRPTDYFSSVPLGKALERFRKVLQYRARENVFTLKIPDRVTESWFPDAPSDVASKLADYENDLRQSLYEENDDIRVRAEARCVREADRIAQQFHLDEVAYGASLPLQPGPFRNGREYRTLYLKSKLHHLGSRTISRARAATELGVTKKTLRKIQAQAGVMTIAQFTPIKINSGTQVIKQVDDGARWAAGREHGRYLDSSGGGRIKLRADAPANMDRWVAAQISQGYTVTAQIQIANLERLATPDELRVIQSEQRRRAEHERDQRRIRDLKNITEKAPHNDGPGRIRQLPSEVVPHTFTQSYIRGQLALTPRDEAPPPDLLPYLRPYITIQGHKEGKKGNKSSDDDPPPA